MPEYTILLTAEQDAALEALIPRINASLPEDTKPFTKASYVQQRAMGVLDSYVAQVLAGETQTITDAYKAADLSKRAKIKEALGLEASP